VQRDTRRATRTAFRLVRATFVVLGAVALATGLSVAPASATVSLAAPAVRSSAAPSLDARHFNAQLTVECVIPAADGTYRAVFGYDNFSGYDVTVPVGQSNKLIPANLNGSQTTVFAVGAHRASFSTPPMPTGVDITWTVGLYTAKASSASNACGPSVNLPAEGNGTAPIFVLVASVIALGVIALRLRRRDRTRTA